MQKKRVDVENQIIGMINSGQFPEGSKLPKERDLAGQLGIGRNLLREAVTVLETLGFLEVRRREGIFVRRIPIGEIGVSLKMVRLWPADFTPQFMEVRQGINLLAVEWAAQRRTEEDIRKLRECFRNLEKTSLVTDEDRHASARWENLLHSLIVDSAHNEILSRICEGMSFLMELNNDRLHRELVEGNTEWLTHIVGQHRKIIEAIETRDSGMAVTVMREHFKDTLVGFGIGQEEGRMNSTVALEFPTGKTGL